MILDKKMEGSPIEIESPKKREPLLSGGRGSTTSIQEVPGEEDDLASNTNSVIYRIKKNVWTPGMGSVNLSDSRLMSKSQSVRNFGVI